MAEYRCPACGREMKFGSYGYYCSGRDEGCKFKVPLTIAERSLPDEEIRSLFETGSTGVITGFISNSGKPFDAYITVEDDGNGGKGLKFNFPERVTEYAEFACPACGGRMAIRAKGYACEADGCKLYLPFVLAGQKLGDDVIQEILETGRSSVIEGFISRNGNTFNAHLEIVDGEDQEGNPVKKLGFVFEDNPMQNVSEFTCPQCGKPMLNGKFGLYCSGKDEGCSFRVNSEIAHKTISFPQISKLMKNGKTDIIKGFTSSKGNKFDARLVIKDGTDRNGNPGKVVAFEFPADEHAELKEKCPNCGAALKSGRFAWECEDGCGFSLRYEIAGHKMSIADAATLFNTGRTGLIRNFKSKTGKEFSGYVVLNEDKMGTKIEFS